MDDGCRRCLLPRIHERPPHIHRGGLHTEELLSRQGCLDERLSALSRSILHNVKNAPTVEVGHERSVPVALQEGFFINTGILDHFLRASRKPPHHGPLSYRLRRFPPDLEKL